MSPLALIALALLPIGVVLLLGLTGFRNGDRPDDTGLQLVLVRRRAPDGWADFAAITVRNPSSGTVIVLAAARPTGLLRVALTAEDRRTALRRPRTLAGSELLGALDGGRERTWLLPLPDNGQRFVRFDVVLEQASGRTRIHTAIRCLSRADPPAMHHGRRAIARRALQASSSVARDGGAPKDCR